MKEITLINNNNMEIEQLNINIFNDIKNIINIARTNITRTINSEMVNCYWNIGKYICQIQENKRANYGSYLLKYLSKQLTKEFGKGFSVENLKAIRKFYEVFSIGYTLCTQLDKCPEYLLKLSWSHIRTIMRLNTKEKRDFYIQECVSCNWSVRQLERQIHTSYYERLLSTQQEYKSEVREEINKLEPNIINKTNPLNILKDPYVLEFLNMKENKKYLEKDLESRIMDNLQDFLLELGKGFCFVARQKRISFNTEHFYIDLVFYNIFLKCYVLIDLKIGIIKHQDMGQMDMYINYFDKEIKLESDNPTIGIVLCAEKNNTVVKYSTLNDNKRLFISKYMDYLPTEEELTNYLIEQKELIEREIE